MLPLRSKEPILSVYLSATQLLSASCSGACVEPEESPADLCTRWLQQSASQLSGYKLDIELSGALTTLFCMPFSAAMDSPAAVMRIAGGYARHALGDSAPTNYAVIEPLNYHQPVLVWGLDPSLAKLGSSRRQQRVIPYAIAAWNRYSSALTERCWMAVLEPERITLLYKHNAYIHDVIVRRLVSNGNAVQSIQTLIRQQFHRSVEAVFVVDEFGLIPMDQTLGTLERITLIQPAFSLVPEKMA